MKLKYPKQQSNKDYAGSLVTKIVVLPERMTQLQSLGRIAPRYCLKLDEQVSK